GSCSCVWRAGDVVCRIVFEPALLTLLLLHDPPASQRGLECPHLRAQWPAIPLDWTAATSHSQYAGQSTHHHHLRRNRAHWSDRHSRASHLGFSGGLPSSLVVSRNARPRSLSEYSRCGRCRLH